MNTLLRILAASALVAGASLAHAGDWLRAPDGLALRAGPGKWDQSKVVAGSVFWDWAWKKPVLNVAGRRWELAAQTEFLVDHWTSVSVRDNKHQTVTLVALMPVIRLQSEASPLFVEFGLGGSWQDGLPTSRWSRWESKWAFYDEAGIGLRFGPGRKHEIGIRVEHASNGGTAMPNPGQDFYTFRLATRF